MNSREISTELNHRKLWYDGDSTVDVSYLYDKLLSGKEISSYYVNEITPEIKQYNRYNNSKLSVKPNIREIVNDWNIPDSYKTIQLKPYILSKLYEEISDNNFSDDEIESRISRVDTELYLWVYHDLQMFLKTLIYVIESFEINDVVWGVGRGSSCCCYILYLIGVHNVDSVLYNLELSDFFKDYKK
jgi:DNA polymerase III alpha subunit